MELIWGMLMVARGGGGCGLVVGCLLVPRSGSWWPKNSSPVFPCTCVSLLLGAALKQGRNRVTATLYYFSWLGYGVSGCYSGG